MYKEINADKLIRAISLLTALRISTEDANEYNDLSESHVGELRATLSSIADMGIDIKEFRIPDSELKPRFLGTSSRGNSYSTEKYVRKSIFLTKLDGIINYLNAILKEPKRTVGYKPPK
jgi:hypothetical protein